MAETGAEVQDETVITGVPVVDMVAEVVMEEMEVTVVTETKSQ